MQTIIHDNHYVPAALLRRWSSDDVHVWSYRMVVSHSRVPEWKRRPIRGVAYHRDLYTVFSGGQELDEFERFLSSRFEQPGLEAIEKLVGGYRVRPADWRSIVRLVAAQEVRTPLSFLEFRKRWDKQIPQILDSVLQKTINDFRNAKDSSFQIENSHAEPNEFTPLLRVEVVKPSPSGPNQALIRAEMSVGRQLWIAAMRHLLSGAAKTLCSHRWSVVEPFDNLDWPISDHPALRLNYYSQGRYDFGGGWGNPGSEIMMPVSPRHLLYVKVGSKSQNRFTFSEEQTRLVQRLLVERAHRWVFTTCPAEWVSIIRPRVVDPKLLEAEQKAWDEWHKNQLQSEKEQDASQRLA